MNELSTFKQVYFILIAILSLQACSHNASESKGSSHEASSPIPAGTPSPKSTIGTAPKPTGASASGYLSSKEGWLVDLDEAYAQSIKDNKPILASFIMSDSCDLCKQLDANVFSTPMFKEWAKKNVVLMEVDLPKRKQLPQKNKEQNAAMAKYLKIAEYPTVWILNVTREEENNRFKVKPIGKVPNEQTPEKFIGLVQNFMRR